MSITVLITAVAGTMLAQSLKIRTRASEKIDALADAQRALNIMSREIANAGFNLSDNGIVAADSVLDGNGNSTIRVRANLNKFDTSAPSTARLGTTMAGWDAGEDVKYFVFPVPGTTNLLARYDPNGSGSTVLANRLDRMRIHYYAQRITYTTASASGVNRGCDITNPSAAEVAPNAAKYVVIAVCVQQSAVGTPGSPGYQPPSNVLLVSDVALRNSNLLVY
jgi:hypothetical protein